MRYCLQARTYVRIMKGSDRLVRWFFPSAEKLELSSEAAVKNMFASGMVRYCASATIRHGSTRKLLAQLNEALGPSDGVLVLLRL